jgi:hypothetical protein
MKKLAKRPGVEAYIYNPSSSGGGDRRTAIWGQPEQTLVQGPISKARTGGMAQVAECLPNVWGPEFKSPVSQN